MSTPVPYTLTTESVSVIVNGESFTFQRETPNYREIRKALFDERWDDIPKYLTIAKVLGDWAKGKFTLKGEDLYFEEDKVPDGFQRRVLEMVSKNESPQPLLNFWEKLQKNPSSRSVEQLFPFLEKESIPITEDGDVLMYKSIREDWMDWHTGKVCNKVGTVNKMPRNKISDDPQQACHYGFHCGHINYAKTFNNSDGRRMVICKVNPENVVCIPYDCSQEKVRVCEYEVIGLFSGYALPSTTITLKGGVSSRDMENSSSQDYEDDYEEEEESEPVRIAVEYDSRKGTYHFSMDISEYEEYGSDVSIGDLEDLGFDNEEDSDYYGMKVGGDTIALKLVEDLEKLGIIVSGDLPPTSAPVVVTPKVTPPPPTPHTPAPSLEGKTLWCDKFNQMAESELFQQNLVELRKYASHDLKITGAFKIPGGKPALIEAIMAARR